MKKIKQIGIFLSKSHTPVFHFFWILRVLIGAPAIFIHEACHFLFIFLLRAKFKLGDWMFLRYVEEEDSTNIRYTFPVSLAGNPSWKNLIIAAAPVLGQIVFFVSCFLIPLSLYDTLLPTAIMYISMMTYFVINWNDFCLSDDDINCIRLNWSIIKESNGYFRIKKFFRTLAVWKKSN